MSSDFPYGSDRDPTTTSRLLDRCNAKWVWMTGISYRPEIDGLRAVAVLSVVLYHAGLGPNGGFVGVDVFFVISGYLITSILRSDLVAKGRIDYLAFYSRRIRRLVPALLVVVGATLGAAIMLQSFVPDVWRVADSGAASLLFVANLFFQAQTGGYFDVAADRLPLLHLWSLGVEEQFYLLWPLGISMLMRSTRRRVLPVLALTAIASFALSEALIFSTPNAAFYQMPARFWELAAGGLVALRPAGNQKDGRLPANVGILIVLGAALIPISHFPGIGALPTVAGTALLLLAVHGSGDLGWVGKTLRSRPMVFFGLISYSLYLWHWPLLAFARAPIVGPLPLALRIVLCVVATALACLSYRYVEQPLRRPGQHGASNLRIVVVGCSTSLASAIALLVFGSVLNRTQPSGDLAARTAADMPRNRIACHFRGDESVSTIPKANCSSAPGRPVHVLIWGDSHALAWQPLAWALAESYGVAATTFTRDACAPALDFDNGKRFLEASRCREFNSRVVDWIVDSDHSADTLIVTARWPGGSDENVFAEKFENTMRTIAPHLRRIILLGATPDLPDSVPRCIAAGQASACSRSRAEFDAHSSATTKMLRTEAARYQNVEYVDLADFFCDREVCPALKDGYGLYWDSNHVSSTAASRFASMYLKVMAKPGDAAPNTAN